MKTIRNKTQQPLRVPLPGGKTLHLGPRKDGQIADNAAEHAGLRRLVEAGSIEILGEGERSDEGANPKTVAEDTHSHARTKFRRGQGER